MQYISLIILIITVFFDLIFYLNLKIHFYIDNKSLYIYIFSLPILVIDKNKYYNFLDNKISFEKITKKNKDNIKLIQSFKIFYVDINIKEEVLLKYPQLCTLFCLNNYNNKINIKSDKKAKIYLVVNLKISNFIKEIIMLRNKRKEL